RAFPSRAWERAISVSLSLREVGSRRSLLNPWGQRRPQRQPQNKMATLKRNRIEMQPAAVGLDDAVADAQAQTSSLAGGFGGEKGIEYLVGNGRVDAAAVVQDVDFHALALALAAPTTPHGDLPARGTGVQGVAGKVEHDLRDLGGKAGHRRQRHQFHGDGDLALVGL